jgi:hypothetical protein
MVKMMQEAGVDVATTEKSTLGRRAWKHQVVSILLEALEARNIRKTRCCLKR